MRGAKEAVSKTLQVERLTAARREKRCSNLPADFPLDRRLAALDAHIDAAAIAAEEDAWARAEFGLDA